MLLVYSEIDKYADEGEVVDMAFLNISRAFDGVTHPLLLHKLQLFGFDPIIILWFRILPNRLRNVCVSVWYDKSLHASNIRRSAGFSMRSDNLFDI